jgi:RNA recognition motif-containing protein
MSLFVGNISKNVKERDFEDEFKNFGPCQVTLKVTIFREVAVWP